MHNVLLMLVSDTSIITRTFYYLKPGYASTKKVDSQISVHLSWWRTGLNPWSFFIISAMFL